MHVLQSQCTHDREKFPVQVNNIIVLILTWLCTVILIPESIALSSCLIPSVMALRANLVAEYMCTVAPIGTMCPYMLQKICEDCTR